MKKNIIIYIVLGVVVCLLLWNFLKVEPINNDKIDITIDEKN